MVKEVLQGLPSGLLVLETLPSSEELPMSSFRLPVRQSPVYDQLVHPNWESWAGGLVVVEGEALLRASRL